MVQEIKTYCCTQCGSTHITKNGKDEKGKQKFHCHNCKYYGTLEPKVKYTQEKKDEILRAYEERSSMRGLERIFGVARQTVASWIKKKAQTYQN